MTTSKLEVIAPADAPVINKITGLKDGWSK